MDLSLKIYEHAAALIGRTPWEASRDPELLFQAHATAYRLYRHRPITPAIDHYNLAPEAYGAKVARPEGNGIPAIPEPLLDGLDAVERLRPYDPSRDGRIPMVLEAALRLAREFSEAAVAVSVDGPFSIASALLGFDRLLCAAVEEPDRLRAALMRLSEGQVVLAEKVHGLGLDVAFAESAAGPPLLSPALFRRVEMPALKELLGRMGRILGHPVSCLMGGDTVKILDDLLETGSPYLVCPRETDQAAFLERLRGRPEILVRVNLDSAVVARGDWEEVRREADRALGLVRGRPNTVLGVGVVPYEARPEVLHRLREYIASGG